MRVTPLLSILLLSLVGCPSAEPEPPGPDPTIGSKVLMDWDGAGFFDAPFPSEHRRNADGTMDVDGFPVIEPVLPFVAELLALVDDVLPGAGTTSGVFLRLEQDPGPLPTLAESVTEQSPVVLMGVDGPDDGVRVPVDVAYTIDGGPYGAIRQLSLLPLQGRPLHPEALYAAVVLRDLGTANGDRLGQQPDVGALARGEVPQGLGSDAAAAYTTALDRLAEHGLAAEDIAGLAVFRTQDPTAEMLAAAAWARSEAPAPAPLIDWTLTDVYDSYCVYRTEVEMPVIQSGTPPFSGEGGAWVIDPDGTPVLQATERARIDVTVPRTAAPAGGFPTVLYVRTGGGADRALIDRGIRDTEGNAFPGTGPAMQLATVGHAGIEVDGPHGGLRNVTESDEQFLMFNMTNPVAMRDNVRQSALELALMPAFVSGLTLDTSDCPDAGATSTFDGADMTLIGHSMGATIGPLAVAAAPELQGAVLSGAGGSWVANVVHKESPIAVRQIADSIVGYTTIGRTLSMHDPLLTLLQWGGESADPPVYGRLLGRAASEPRDLLMIQGIVDTYILPPMANATSLSLGLDLVGPGLDATDERLVDYAAWEDVVGLSEDPGAATTAPLSGNLPDGRTGAVVMFEEDPLEDGHEVFFQLDEPKRLLRCWLATAAAGTAEVVDDASDCP